MSTLSRDIQQLNLAANNITSLKWAEFQGKKFVNLQKIYLNSNQIEKIHPGAFYKLTGLIELDLSDNLLVSFESEFEEEANVVDEAIASLAPPTEAEEEEEEEVEEEEDEEEENEEDEEAKVRRVAARKKLEAKLDHSGSPGRREKTTFLQDLSQVRELNLASNQLKRLDKFTFSALTQLRQLDLSR